MEDKSKQLKDRERIIVFLNAAIKVMNLAAPVSGVPIRIILRTLCVLVEEASLSVTVCLGFTYVQDAMTNEMEYLEPELEHLDNCSALDRIPMNRNTTDNLSQPVRDAINQFTMTMKVIQTAVEEDKWKLVSQAKEAVASSKPDLSKILGGLDARRKAHFAGDPVNLDMSPRARL